MNKKNFNYLYSLLILNNINAGCKKRCGKTEDNNTQKKQHSQQSSGQNDGQENPKEEESKGENPDLEEEKKKKEEEEKKKTPEEIEKERIQKLEEERLNKKADEIIEFLKILDTASKNSIHDKNTIINGTINKEELKSCIKYLQELDFSTISTEAYTDKNVYEDIYIKLFKIIDIDGQEKESILNDFSTNVKNDRKGDGTNIYSLFENILFGKYFGQLFTFGTTKCNLVIVKDKRNKEIHFVLEDNDQIYNDRNENFEKIRICFGGTPNIQKINQSTNQCSDIEMNLALNLSKTLFIALIKSIGLSKIIIKHLEDSKSILPNHKYASSIILSYYKQKNPNYYFRYSNDYNYLYTKEEIDANKLYSFESLIKIETTDDFYLKFTEKIGKIKSNLKSAYKNVPLEYSTYENISNKLKELDDVNKIIDVQKDILELIKKDNVYKGEYITIENYKIIFYSLNFKNFDKKNIKNTDFPYCYNIYIYKDNNEIKVEIKKWGESDKIKRYERLIDDFKKNFENLFPGQEILYSRISSLISIINSNITKDNLYQIINMKFSQLLSNEKWDELDKLKKLDNLCIEIADDLSSIKLGKNLIKKDNHKLFLLKKNTLTGPGYSYFCSEEKN